MKKSSWGKTPKIYNESVDHLTLTSKQEPREFCSQCGLWGLAFHKYDNPENKRETWIRYECTQCNYKRKLKLTMKVIDDKRKKIHD